MRIKDTNLDEDSKETNKQYPKDKKKVSKKRKRKNKNIFLTILYIIITICIWSGLFYYGYTYSKEYIDNSMSEINQINNLSMENMEKRLDVLTKEVRSLKDAILETDDTLDDSSNIQEEIDKKLKALDNQLKTLERSLNILKDAPNGQN